MKTTVLYVGSSLLSPLRQAEGEIDRLCEGGFSLAAHNLGGPLNEREWSKIESDVEESDSIFIIHVTDGENASRLVALLKRYERLKSDERRPVSVVVINCMPELMRLTRLGKLRFDGGDAVRSNGDDAKKGARGRTLLRSAASWMGEQARARRGAGAGSHARYMRFAERLPTLLRFVPSAGRLRDVKHYLTLYCYFLQPTPANIRSMLLYALKHYAPSARLKSVELPQPESMPGVGIYHPDAVSIFDGFEAFRAWWERRGDPHVASTLDPEKTVGLLLMRTNIVSGSRQHYDGLIRAIEREGLGVLPVISTFMDNREAVARFLLDETARELRSDKRSTGSNLKGGLASDSSKPRVSQLLTLTGFSFVGGPANNDSEAAVKFLNEMNRPLRSAVSLDVQTVESWLESWTGLNPVQTGMQVAIPELDGATEPFVFGGMSMSAEEPLALEERCARIARRLARWNRLRTAPRDELKLAFVLFSFPPNKGNLGTAADLDVFPSLRAILEKLKDEGYDVELPRDTDELKRRILGGDDETYGAAASVAHRMKVSDYARLFPHVDEISREWGAPPGSINSFGGELLILGAHFGKAFVGVQPSFGHEGDPMRMLMSRDGAPHHGFAAFYTYIEKIFRADAIVHVGTHGALEFMPGKQVGLSGACWPDRLIGELPHLYLYSVNNPSEGTIARRRAYAELISYLTPPVEEAGLYRDLASLKEMIAAYRRSADEREREQLFDAIEELARSLNLTNAHRTDA